MVLPAPFAPSRPRIPGGTIRLTSSSARTLPRKVLLTREITGLTFAGVKDYISDLFTGTALVLAVAVSSVLGRRRAGAD